MSKHPKKKTAPAPQAPVGLIRGVLNKTTLGETIFWVVNVAVAIKLSNVLQSLTNGALWFPEPWREAFGFISSLSFIAITIIVGKMFEPKGKSHSKQHFRSVKSRALVALLFLGVAAYSVDQTKQLRNKYIFDVPETDQWWLAQYGNPDGKTGDHKTPARHWWQFSFGKQEAQATGQKLDADDLKTPDYLSYGYQCFYFPYLDQDARMTNWVPRVQLDANLKGALSPDTNDIRACIDLMLTIEPANFIHEGESDSELTIRGEIDFEFMLYHFLTILSLAAAWGLLKEEQETILDAVLDLVRAKA